MGPKKNFVPSHTHDLCSSAATDAKNNHCITIMSGKQGTTHPKAKSSKATVKAKAAQDKDGLEIQQDYEEAQNRAAAQVELKSKGLKQSDLDDIGDYDLSQYNHDSREDD